MSSFIDMFTNMKTVLCMCPNCNKLMRLSDLHLRSEGEAEKTWLDKHDSKIDTFEIKEKEFVQVVIMRQFQKIPLKKHSRTKKEAICGIFYPYSQELLVELLVELLHTW